MSDDAPKRDEARERAAETSPRPDVQGGALRMAEGDEPDEHEYPSLRETSNRDDEA